MSQPIPGLNTTSEALAFSFHYVNPLMCGMQDVENVLPDCSGNHHAVPHHNNIVHYVEAGLVHVTRLYLGRQWSRILWEPNCYNLDAVRRSFVLLSGCLYSVPCDYIVWWVWGLCASTAALSVIIYKLIDVRLCPSMMAMSKLLSATSTVSKLLNPYVLSYLFFRTLWICWWFIWWV